MKHLTFLVQMAINANDRVLNNMLANNDKSIWAKY